MTSSQVQKAQTLRSLHVPGDPLIVTNVWDAASAAVVAAVPGTRAIATASMAVSHLFGVEDGEGLSLEQALDMAIRIVEAAGDLPVSVDFEAGYAEDPDGVREAVIALARTGAVGLNLEDAMPGSPVLFARDAQVARVRAVQEAADAAGVPLVLNARADGLVRGQDWADTRDRALAYREAGADAIFLLGLADEQGIARAVQEIPAPIALLAGPSSPPPARLAELGVARVSFGPGLHRVAMAALRTASEALQRGGEYPPELR